jgi:hypothetical protein
MLAAFFCVVEDAGELELEEGSELELEPEFELDDSLLESFAEEVLLFPIWLQLTKIKLAKAKDEKTTIVFVFCFINPLFNLNARIKDSLPLILTLKQGES